jgi:hypothetical protein
VKLLAKKVITGCESDGTAHSPYLTRYTLIQSRLGAAYIHVFHRSDRDDHHDHPWNFLSVILWRGYFEETEVISDHNWKGDPYYLRIKKRVWPGTILFRRATWKHRVVLVDEQPAVTLVIRGPYLREWGFILRVGHRRAWQRWKEYFEERGC